MSERRALEITGWGCADCQAIGDLCERHMQAIGDISHIAAPEPSAPADDARPLLDQKERDQLTRWAAQVVDPESQLAKYGFITDGKLRHADSVLRYESALTAAESELERSEHRTAELKTYLAAAESRADALARENQTIRGLVQRFLDALMLRNAGSESTEELSNNTRGVNEAVLALRNELMDRS